MGANRFGNLLKGHRLRRGYGLRRFARLVGELPSNLSAIESGTRNPPRTSERLRKFADALALMEGSLEWDEFFFAARRPGVILPDMEKWLERDMNLVLLRTVDECRLSDDDLRRLVEDIRKQRHQRNDDGD